MGMNILLKQTPVILFVIFISFNCSSREKTKTEDSNSNKSPIPDYIFHDVIHYHYENGTLKTKIVFEKGDFYSASNELSIENCSFVYYDIDGLVISRGSSKKAKVYGDQSELIAERDVVVISEENKGRLETEYLEWHGDQDQFTTDRFVTITQENGDTITGVGMTADVGLKLITIHKDVRGSFTESGDEY